MSWNEVCMRQLHKISKQFNYLYTDTVFSLFHKYNICPEKSPAILIMRMVS